MLMGMENFNSHNGEYVVLARRGGFLENGAAEEFSLLAEREADFIYADEAVIRDDGSTETVYKPVFSPHTLLSYNYIGSPIAVKRTLYEKLGGADEADESALYAFTLRATELAKRVGHVPRVLYTGGRPEARDDSGIVQGELNRRGVRAEALPGLFRGSCCVRPGMRPGTKAAVVVPFTGDADALRFTLESVEAVSTFRDYKLYVVYGCVADARAQRYFQALSENGAARILHYAKETNTRVLKNEAAAAVREDALLFLEAGVVLASHDAVGRMMEYAFLPRVATVGAKILDREKKLLHTGFVLGIGDEPVSLLAGHADTIGSDAVNRYANCIRDVTATGGGALMMERAKFFSAGGFDETMPSCADDAELGLRCRRAGLYNVYQPYARFIRQGKGEACQEVKDGERRLLDAFFPAMAEGDPMLSTNPLAYKKFAPAAEPAQ